MLEEYNSVLSTTTDADIGKTQKAADVSVDL